MFNRLKLIFIAYALLISHTAAFAVERVDTQKKVSAPLDFILNNGLIKNSDVIDTTAEEITLKKIGLINGLTLSGDKLQSGISFTLPYDFIVINAEIRLIISIKETENIEKDNLQITLNDQSLGSIPLSQLHENKSTFTLKVPNAILSSKNNLNFQIISNDDIINNEWTCQRPDLKDLNLEISPLTSMALKGVLMNTRKSLMDFPRPFLDPLKMNSNELAFIYAASPTPDTLMASAIVASIFGIKSGEKGNHFNIYLDELPEKHAVLFTMADETISGISFNQAKGPNIRIIDNPVNEKYKILVISGRHAHELRQAAYQLFTPDLPDSSDMAIANYHVQKRQAYDAPNWLSAKKIITFSQIIKSRDALQSRLFWNEEKNIIFRLPPDVFMLSGNKIPVKIDYTFDGKNWIDMKHSMLTIALNYQFLKNISDQKHSIISPITEFFTNNHDNSTTLYLDSASLFGENRLSFYFNITPHQETPCNIRNNGEIVNQILSSSTFDLSNISNFGELPNTAWFLNGLFPFTKYADLSDTVILLTKNPAKEEIALMLHLMEKAGRITGFPVSQVTILTDTTKPQNNLKLTSSNIIAISKLKEIAAFKPLIKDTSYHYSYGQLQVMPPSLLQKLKLLLLGEWKNQFEEANNILINSQKWRGLLSFPSPWSSNKVVTILTATNSEQLKKLHDDIDKPGRQQLESGDILLFNDFDDVKVLRVNASFLSGELPLHTLVLWFFSQHLFLLMAMLFTTLFLMSLYLFKRLKNHESKRLSRMKK